MRLAQCPPPEGYCWAGFFIGLRRGKFLVLTHTKDPGGLASACVGAVRGIR